MKWSDGKLSYFILEGEEKNEINKIKMLEDEIRSKRI